MDEVEGKGDSKLERKEWCEIDVDRRWVRDGVEMSKYNRKKFDPTINIGMCLHLFR